MSQLYHGAVEADVTLRRSTEPGGCCEQDGPANSCCWWLVDGENRAARRRTGGVSGRRDVPAFIDDHLQAAGNAGAGSRDRRG